MSLMNRISRTLANYQQILGQFFRDPRYPELCLVGAPELRIPIQNQNESNEMLERAIVWNTPKNRKTIEKRTMAKFGGKEWGNCKIWKADKRIRVDHRTGEYFQLGKLAPKTYKTVMDETKEIQKKISSYFSDGLKPRDTEVVVKYQDDDRENLEKSLPIVEMEKPRPSFFSSNLMQRAKPSSQAAKTTSVRPTGLG